MMYQFKITIKGFKPPIWRRILVDSNMTFYVFHHVIQSAFKWTDSHLHEFMFKEKGQTNYFEGISVGPPSVDDSWGFKKTQDERQVPITKYFKNENDRGLYIYDFGEDWQHEILLEKVLEEDETIQLPHCVKAMRLAPPEDSRFYFDNRETVDNKALRDEINEDFEVLVEQLNKGVPSLFDAEEDEYEYEEDPIHLHELYTEIKLFQSLKPWKLLDNGQIIACFLDEWDEWVYCSVMGSGGQEFGLVLYIGDEGLESLQMLLKGETDMAELAKSQNALVLSFTDLKDLDQPAVMTMFESGVVFNDQTMLPYLTNYEPGFLPWSFDVDDIAIFWEVLTKLNRLFQAENLEVLKDAPCYDGEKENQMLSIISKPEIGEHALEIGLLEIEDNSVLDYPLLISEIELKRVQKQCKLYSIATMEFDAFYGDDPVQDSEDERPYFPLIVVIGDHHSGMVNHIDVLPYGDEEQIQQVFLQALKKIGVIPGTLLVRNEKIHSLIKPIAKVLSIKLIIVDHLDVIEDVKANLPGVRKK